MTIYILQHTTTGTLLAYTQIGAFLLDPANPITVQPRQWSNLCKEGYPVRYREWVVWKLWAKTGKDVRAET
jgi:hypothetical protein